MSPFSAPLPQAEKRKLRAKAQTMEATVFVGKNGLSDEFYKELDHLLDIHGLVKGKFVQHKEDRKTLAPQIARSLDAELVTLVGNVFVLHRPKRAVKTP
ncbi:YhbY family RNA-binding protein [Kamptonema cortianum]|nr:YhbY family RNA-binding protein [Kamptonema cortianum]MDL5046223.1 YhbY family RNA-binding protein [Oscillatoria amoena NRMC-F 0135]